MDENKNIDPKLEAALKGIWESLTDEQKEKAKACKSWDELTQLAGKEGIELPDEVLDAVAGGYIYYGRSWEVIHDTGGWRMSKCAFSKEEAISVAKTYGLSTEEISLDRVNQIRADFEKRNSSGC